MEREAGGVIAATTARANSGYNTHRRVVVRSQDILNRHKSPDPERVIRLDESCYDRELHRPEDTLHYMILLMLLRDGYVVHIQTKDICHQNKRLFLLHEFNNPPVNRSEPEMSYVIGDTVFQRDCTLLASTSLIIAKSPLERPCIRDR